MALGAPNTLHLLRTLISSELYHCKQAEIIRPQEVCAEKDSSRQEPYRAYLRHLGCLLCCPAVNRGDGWIPDENI